MSETNPIVKLDSTSQLSALPRCEFVVPSTTEARIVSAKFDEVPALSGALIVDQGALVGVISRAAMHRLVGRPFGREVFLSRTVRDMISVGQLPTALVLPMETLIHDAAQLALDRERASKYEPVVGDMGEGKWGLIDVWNILNAQSKILSSQIEAHRVAVAQAQAAESKYRSIFENAIEGIIQVDIQGRYLNVNPALARIYGFDSPEEFLAHVASAPIESLYANPSERADLIRQATTDTAVHAAETQVRRKDGTLIWVVVQVHAVRDPAGNAEYIEGTLQDITARKLAEAEREELQRKLLDTSRQAGMAEVATGVLHNVGNVLNSVAVSNAVLNEKLRQSKVANLAKALGMLESHRSDLAAFLERDEKGKQILGYLGKLAGVLGQEQTSMVEELVSMNRSVEHIQQIVAAQQSFAKVSAVVEKFKITDVIEEALRINAVSFERHHIQVVRQFAAQPIVEADKHHVIQILVNLVSNAKRALRDCAHDDRQVILQVELFTHDSGKDFVRIVVHDNGPGIAPENLTRIFHHGFTTRADGHGFGLHNSANSAKQMGGSLTASSAGLGHGAVFTLDLPVHSTEAVIV